MLFLGVNFTLIKFFICTLVIYYLYFIYRNWKYIQISRKNTGFFMPILPLAGNVYLSILSGALDGISFFQWVHNYFGFPFNLWYGNVYYYVTIDTAETQIILNHPKCMNKSSLYEKLNFGMEKSLLLIPYESWKPQRKNFSKCFSPAVSKANVPIFYTRSCQMIRELTSIQVPKDIFKFFINYSFTNFFSGNGGVGEDSASQVERMSDITIEGSELLKSLFIHPWLDAKVWLTIFPAGRKAAKLYEEIITFTKQIIEYKKKHGRGKRLEYVESTKATCLLDFIVAEMNELDALHQIQMFTGAATVTTGVTLGFSFLLLGMYQDIQEIIYREVIKVVGDNENTNQDIPNFKYIEAVIYETLRLFPVVPFVARKCDDDVDLGTKILPKGSSSVISIFHIHRDPRNWRNPLRFDPTRFLPENQTKIIPGSFLPFSHGPRDCIGKAEAMTVLKLTVANVVRHFKIKSNHRSIEEFSLMSGITLRIKNKVDCQFTPRCK